MIKLEKDFIQQKQFDRFVQDFIGKTEAPNKEDIDRFIDEIKTLERFTMDSKRFYVLFDHSKFYPVYISQNVEKEGGYSVDYILNQGLWFLFQRIHWKQLTLAYKVNKWGSRFQKLIGVHVPIIHQEVCCCGVKFKDK